MAGRASASGSSSAADRFARRVLAVVTRIPPGRVCTYGDAPPMAGAPGAARAAGNVMATARVPGVPYHRVLAARVFETLRSHDLPYWQVFLTTAVLYVFGTFSYNGLIRAVERKEAEEVMPEGNPETGQV